MHSISSHLVGWNWVGIWFCISGETTLQGLLVGSLEMLHTDSLWIPYRWRLTPMATVTHIMDLLYLILHQWVIDHRCLPMVTNHTQDTLQCHLFLLPHSMADPTLHLTMLSSMAIINNTYLPRYHTILISHQILTKEMIINTLDHIIMKEISIRVVGVGIISINPQDIIRTPGLSTIRKVHMVVTIMMLVIITKLFTTTQTSNHLEPIRVGLRETIRVETGNMVIIPPINFLY